MIIGIDASRANVKNRTGTEWYAYYLIEEFKKMADPKDQFILYSKEVLQGSLGNLPHNFTSKVLSWPPGLLWTQIRLAWEMLWHAPDALFVPAHTIPIITPSRTITTLHDIGFEKYEHLYKNKEIGPHNYLLRKILKFLVRLFTLGKYSTTELDYHRWSTRLALKKASQVITISQFSKQEIVSEFGIKESLLVVIPNGFSPSYVHITDSYKINSVLKKYSLDSPYFLFIGRLEEKKNITGLLEGFSYYKKRFDSAAKMILVGTPGHGFKKIQDTINAHSLSDSVMLPGWIGEDELNLLMNGADIFIFPSWYEGFGMPILEAMACGTPVITSNRGATKETAGQAAYLVDPANATEIGEGINKILSDHNLRDHLIDQGFKRIKKYSWSNTARQVLKIITIPK